MGMFDTVKYEMKCPNCGNLLDDFQSKDGKCMLKIIDPSEVDNFYTDCSKCGSWIELNRIKNTNKFHGVCQINNSDEIIEFEIII